MDATKTHSTFSAGSIHVDSTGPVSTLRIAKRPTQDDSAAMLRARTAMAYAMFYNKTVTVPVIRTVGFDVLRAAELRSWSIIMPTVLPTPLLRLAKAKAGIENTATAPEEWARYVITTFANDWPDALNLKDPSSLGWLFYSTDMLNPIVSQPLIMLVHPKLDVMQGLSAQFNHSLRWLMANPTEQHSLTMAWDTVR